MFTKTVLAVAVLVGAVAAQTSNNTIDPNSIPLTTRSQWCQGQTNTCGTLCSGAVGTNKCDPPSLNYTCTCASNNSAPGLQYYTETLPTFECLKIFENCINANANDAAAQALCTSNKNKNCGTLNPDNFTAAAVSTTSSAASTATSATSATAGSASSTSSSKAAGPTLAPMRFLGSNMGTGAIAVGVGAAFGYLL